MNLKTLFEAQRKLDEHIIHEKGLEGKDLLPNTILALQVEYGELANCWRGFKHWSNDRNPRVSGLRGDEPYNPMLEEYADCLSFILSLGLQNEFERLLVLKEKYSDTQRTTTEIFLHLFANAIYLGGNYYRMDILDFEHYFVSFLELGVRLGFTWEQIEQAYYAKNKINHERQETGY